MNHTYILTLSCPDRPGIVHAVSGFLFEHGGNIEEAAQYNDHGTGLFFMRVQFACDQLTHDDLRPALKLFAEPFGMRLEAARRRRSRCAPCILVSKEGHCLNDLLFRWKSGLLPLDIRAIICNHRDFYQLAASYNVPVPPHPGDGGHQGAGRSAASCEIIEAEGAELVVLARYMQILSNDLCRKLAGRAINIHHCFLPSFKGAKPYYQAHDRGVKLIGATAHYVTADLDEGPIIEQDVARVDHSDTVEDLTAQGRDTESQVLARAVKWHSEHRVLLNGHKTVIFKWRIHEPCRVASTPEWRPPAARRPVPTGSPRRAQRSARIPPIQCLLTFEALARLRSVTQTAEELNVTPSAVSHRVKQLEQILGTKLFGRADFSLTTEGSEYLAHVREGLATLQKFPGTARPAPGQAQAARWPSRPPLRARS